MGAKSKIELLLSLKNKVGAPLKKAKEKIKSTVGDMKEKLKSLEISHIKAFQAMRDELPVFDRALKLLGNPYVLITAGIISVTALLGQASNAAASFNNEFLQVKNLNLDKNEKQLNDYKGLIKSTALDIGTNLNETTRAFYDIQSATGLYGREAKQVFEQVGKFSIATGAQLNDSINSTTKAMKAFGLGTKDIRGLLESNAKTVQVGIVTFEELARVQTEYAGAASAVGANVDTANKVFAAFTSIAKDANSAATMTKTAFDGMTQANTIKGLKGIGVEMYEANGQMRDLSEVLKEVGDRFSTMSPQAIDETINKIGGSEGLRNLFLKLKTDAGDFFNTLEAFDSSSFNLDAALKNAKQDFSTLMQMTRNRFQNIMAGLGEKVLPHVVKMLEWLNSNILGNERNFNRLANTVRLVVKGLVTFKATTFLLKKGLHLLKIGTIAYNFTANLLSNGLKSVTKSMKAMNATMKANLIGLAVTGVVLLIDKLRSMRKESSSAKVELRSMGEVAGDFRKRISESAGAANSLFEQLKRTKEGTKERGALISKINDQYGKYLDKLLTEKSSLQDIEKAQRRVNEGMIKKAQLQAYQDEMVKVFQAQAETKMKNERERRKKFSYLTDDQYRAAKELKKAEYDKMTDTEIKELLNRNSQKEAEYIKATTSTDVITPTVSLFQDMFGVEETMQDKRNKKIRGKIFDSKDNLDSEFLKDYLADKQALNQANQLASELSGGTSFDEFINTKNEDSPEGSGSDGESGGSYTPVTGESSVNRVVGHAKQIQNLNVSIENMNKDGITVNVQELNEEETSSVEDFFEQLLMRAIRSVETSYS